MTVTDETLAGQPEGDTAPAATPPAPPEADIEARLTQKFEDRIKGFQRLVDEKDRALKDAQSKLTDLQMSGMSEDEKAEAEWNGLQAQVDKLQAENALLALASEYPEEMPEFKKLLNASDPKEQLEVIRALRAAAKAAAPAPETPDGGEPEIPDVDPNNPLARQSSGGPTFNGQVMDENWADRLLQSVKRMRT